MQNNNDKWTDPKARAIVKGMQCRETQQMIHQMVQTSFHTAGYCYSWNNHPQGVPVHSHRWRLVLAEFLTVGIVNCDEDVYFILVWKTTENGWMHFTEGRKYNQRVKRCFCATFTISVIMLKSFKMADHVLSQQFVAELGPHLQDDHSVKKLHKCNLISILHITKTSPLIRYAVCNIRCCTLMLHIEHGTNQHFPQCRPQQK